MLCNIWKKFKNPPPVLLVNGIDKEVIDKNKDRFNTILNDKVRLIAIEYFVYGNLENSISSLDFMSILVDCLKRHNCTQQELIEGIQQCCIEQIKEINR